MKYALLFISLLIGNVAIAQCNSCNLPDSADYCFTDSLFIDYCAAFKESAVTFQLKNGKKTRTIPLENEINTEYFLQLISNKKRKITAKDILFIELALEKWEKEKLLLGYEIDDEGLGIKILQEGKGPTPEKGEKIKVHYTGMLTDGTKFDSSVDRGQPFEFTLGQGRVIKGWDKAFAQLKKGTKAVILIPSELGYGARGAGGVIPPNATLIFEVELME